MRIKSGKTLGMTVRYFKCSLLVSLIKFKYIYIYIYLFNLVRKHKFIVSKFCAQLKNEKAKPSYTFTALRFTISYSNNNKFELKAL